MSYLFMILRTACSRGSRAQRHSGTWLCEHIKLLDPATPEARVSLHFSLSSFWKLFFFLIPCTKRHSEDMDMNMAKKHLVGSAGMKGDMS